MPSHDDAGGRAVDPAIEPPPILGRWSRLYALVITALAAMIAFLLWLTRAWP